MYDPIGGFQRIRDQYLAYLETAFRIADPRVSAERRNLLERAGQLCTEPLLEPIPRYVPEAWDIRDLPDHAADVLPGFDDQSVSLFTQLISSGLFDRGDIPLHKHQATMLARGTRRGSPGIVTSGTGSGKTESFLLPVIASIVDEGVRTWDAPESDFLKKRWWHGADGRAYTKYTEIPKGLRPLKANPDSDPFVRHRHGENRPAAVRALVLYPMNALVEDQLGRLRTALDSESAASVLRGGLDGNRIFFGRYTGETPITGFNVHPRFDPREDYSRRGRLLQRLFDHCVEIEETQSQIRQMIAKGTLAPGDRFLFPSADGAELVTRWDIQQDPPDILISNISMLGAMLNREVEAPIFEKTREWLRSSDDSYFYLVLDELHLYRGTAGTEVAYLVRMLLDRLGLTEAANRHKLRILASKASLPTAGSEGARSRTYLWDMFGDHGTFAEPAHGSGRFWCLGRGNHPRGPGSRSAAARTTSCLSRRSPISSAHVTERLRSRSLRSFRTLATCRRCGSGWPKPSKWRSLSCRIRSGSASKRRVAGSLPLVGQILTKGFERPLRVIWPIESSAGRVPSLPYGDWRSCGASATPTRHGFRMLRHHKPPVSGCIHSSALSRASTRHWTEASRPTSSIKGKAACTESCPSSGHSPLEADRPPDPWISSTARGVANSSSAGCVEGRARRSSSSCRSRPTWKDCPTPPHRDVSRTWDMRRTRCSGPNRRGTFLSRTTKTYRTGSKPI